MRIPSRLEALAMTAAACWLLVCPFSRWELALPSGPLMLVSLLLTMELLAHRLGAGRWFRPRVRPDQIQAARSQYQLQPWGLLLIAVGIIAGDGGGVASVLSTIFLIMPGLWVWLLGASCGQPAFPALRLDRVLATALLVSLIAPGIEMAATHSWEGLAAVAAMTIYAAGTLVEHSPRRRLTPAVFIPIALSLPIMALGPDWVRVVVAGYQLLVLGSVLLVRLPAMPPVVLLGDRVSATPLEERERELPVLGFRGWQVEAMFDSGPDGEQLRYALGSLNQFPGRFVNQESVAACTVGHHGPQIPHPGCECGLYATYNLQDVRVWRADLEPCLHCVVGAVAGYGEVLEHPEGWRSSHQRVIAIWDRSEGRGADKLAFQVAAQLQVPCLPKEGLIAFACEQAEPIQPQRG